MWKFGHFADECKTAQVGAKNASKPKYPPDRQGASSSKVRMTYDNSPLTEEQAQEILWSAFMVSDDVDGVPCDSSDNMSQA